MVIRTDLHYGKAEAVISGVCVCVCVCVCECVCVIVIYLLSIKIVLIQITEAVAFIEVFPS
jgi:hypothetical protein